MRDTITEWVILAFILAIFGSVSWAVIDSAHKAYTAEQERQANKTCKTMFGRVVDCPSGR